MPAVFDGRPATETTAQVLSAFESLHGLVVPKIQRDIKPENILIRKWSAHKVHLMLWRLRLVERGETSGAA